MFEWLELVEEHSGTRVLTVLYWSRSLVSFPDHFSPHGKNWSGERPSPFSFPPPNVSGPIRLLCERDVIHGNNGDQESWAIEAVCRRLGCAGLKPASEKAVRSFANGRDVLRGCQPWMESLNASKIAPESVAERGVSFQDRRFLVIGTSREDNLLQRCVSGRRYRVPQ